MPDSSLHALLTAVERLDPEACGAFVVTVDGATTGSVFVEQNHVCWAAYDGLRSRLRDLLREGDAMREAIRQHTIESLLELVQDRGETITWTTHSSASYQPRFTYSPAELLVAANALLYVGEAEGTAAELAALGPDVNAASFVPADGGGVVAVGSTGDQLTINDLDDLGAWADAAFAVTRGFSRDVVRRSVEANTGELRIAWQTSRKHTFAVVSDHGPALDRLLAMLEQRTLPTIVSRRALRSPMAVRDGLGAVATNSVRP